MQKIMIVDDEVIFRDFLRASIDWAAYDYEIVAEARNGIEALKIAEEFRPDVALVDINMPQMNGIAFAEQLQEKGLDTKVVLITGHSEFEYARKAVKLGVEDYILKPFEKEELILTLLRLGRKDIHEPQAAKVNQSAYHREKFLNYLVSEDYDDKDEETVRELESLGIPLHSEDYQIICVEIDRMEQRWEVTSERKLWKFAVGNILSDTLSNVEPIVFNGSEGRIVCILQGKSGMSRGELMEALARLCELISKYLKFTITIGVGRSKKGYSGLSQSYQDAIDALRFKFILGNNRVLTYEDIETDSELSGAYTSALNEEFLLQLRLHDWNAVKGTIDQIFGHIRARKLSTDYAFMICVGLASHCFTYIASIGRQVDEVFGEPIYPYAAIQNKETLEEVYEWIVHIYRETMQYAQSLKLTRSGKLALMARTYIEEQYSDPDLGIEQIAQHVYVNSSYLRSSFKKEYGMTINDYVTQIRMNKAKELLSRKQTKLSDIAYAVGYSDPGYFSKCFKKNFGISPSEFEMMQS